MITQAEFRTFFQVAGTRLFFNHAAYAPLSKPVVQAMNDYFAVRSHGDPASWSIAEEHVEGLRNNFAQLVGATPPRIAMMQNTVTGVNILANGLAWQAGDHILLYADEFPSNVMPFLNLQDRGVEVEFIKAPDGRVSLERFAAAIKPNTRLISLSSVQYLTGFRADLKPIADLCHQQGAYFSVDGIQSVGVIPTDVIESGIDFLAVGGHKWLMSPLGAGFIYVTEALQSELKLAFRGYMGHVNPIDFGNFEQELSPHARRFELGAFNAPSIVGAHQATELLLACGIENIFRHVRKLIHRFEEGITSLPFETMYHFEEQETSGICMFTHENAELNEKVFNSLSDQKVNISLRGGGLRLAPHYYNTVEEIEAFLALLNSLG